jgi:glycosyltransferase involved in cell wall biosynthesis
MSRAIHSRDRSVRARARDGHRPLILLSGHAGPNRADRTERPQADFDALAARVDGQISCPDPGAPAVAALEERLRLGVSQAVRAHRSSASVYVSLSERVGIPLSLLRPRAPHLMVAHLLTSGKKRLIARRTGFLRRTDLTLVFSRDQERFLREDMGLDEHQVQFIWDKVDHRFFSPGPAGPVTEGDGYVLSVGREQRDYETLIEALRPLKVPSVIVPGSAWSHREASTPSVTARSLPGRSYGRGAGPAGHPLRGGCERDSRGDVVRPAGGGHRHARAERIRRGRRERTAGCRG